MVAFDDAPNDATGPGSYVPPGDSEFTDGDFDLRRFAVLADGDDVILEVTLGASIRRPEITQRANSTPIPLDNGIYLQNVDIYVDSDPAGPPGFGACIPGRRVAFAGGRTWKAAVVLTPQPGPAEEITRKVLGDAARHVLFVRDVQSHGRTLVARVPAAALGGLPRPDWGWSVQVSGASWARSFEVLDRLRGSVEANAFTMPVRTLREAWAFGGGPPGNTHPRVVDVLLPPGVDQQRILGSYDEATGAFARVPFVYATRPPPPAPTPITAETPLPTPPLTVVDVVGDMVSVKGSPAGVKPFQIGRVLGPDGATVARIVVTQLLPGGLVASAVDGRERIEPGATVRFDGQAP